MRIQTDFRLNAATSSRPAADLYRMRPLCEKLKRTTLMRGRASRICGGQGGLIFGGRKVSGERSSSDKD